MIDTSSIVEGHLEGDYPMAHFQTLWERIEELLENGEMISTAECFIELEQKDDDLLAWARHRRRMFWDPTPDVQGVVARLMSSLPNFVDIERRRSTADPFVVAQASVLRGTVVCQEGRARSARVPKIPDACGVEGLRCIRLAGLIVEKGWKF